MGAVMLARSRLWTLLVSLPFPPIRALDIPLMKIDFDRPPLLVVLLLSD